jgi:O-antigen ligase
MKISMRLFPVWFGLMPILAATKLGLITDIAELGRWFLMAVGVWGAFKWGPQRENHWFKNYWAWGLIFCCGVSALWSIVPKYTIMRTVSVGLLYICSFGALRHWVNKYGIELLFSQLEKLLGLTITLNLLLGLTIIPNAWTVGAFNGAFTNPNTVALLCAFATPVLLRQYLSQATFIRSTLLVAVLFSIILSGGRTGALMALTSWLIIVIGGKSRYRLILIILLCALSITVIPLIVTEITSFFLNSGPDNLLSNRQWAWEVVFEKIANRPWFGHGFGSDMLIWDYYGIDLGYRMHGTASSYYGMLFQFGWPITILFFLIIGYLTLRTLYIGIRTQGICLVYGSVLLSGLLASYTEPWIYSAGNAFSWLYWTIAMLAVREAWLARKSTYRSHL